MAGRVMVLRGGPGCDVTVYRGWTLREAGHREIEAVQLATGRRETFTTMAVAKALIAEGRVR